ncbi:MAG: ATP synthase F1 subunit epsilon [Eubacteriales bacterium]|nr:ATP synthase F1 subunit epsilon [Eubacteriales bacterium]NCU26826.1 ATP synthase F1 subunit epsilon [Candidatus Nomurabacteria bacterium]
MTDKLHVEIVTPYELFYEGEVDSVILPALDGEIGIMPGHSPIVIALNPGELRLSNDNETIYASVADGFAQIEIDNVIIVVGSAELPEQIDLKRAEEALDRAVKRLADPTTTARERIRSGRGILRAKARIKVHSKK